MPNLALPSTFEQAQKDLIELNTALQAREHALSTHEANHNAALAERDAIAADIALLQQHANALAEGEEDRLARQSDLSGDVLDTNAPDNAEATPRGDFETPAEAAQPDADADEDDDFDADL